MPNIKIKEENSDETLNLAFDILEKKKQALVFVNTKKSAESVAEKIAGKIKTSSKELDELSYKIEHSLSSPTKQCKRLGMCVKKGIAFHHAGLVHQQRELIEDNFRSGNIKIICCTPTLAYGLDLPAFRVIIRDLKRFGMHGSEGIPVLEYLQISGRAGRPKYDSYGESVAIAKSEHEKKSIIEEYVFGEPEEIYSKLAVEPVLRTYVLSLISTEFVGTKKELVKFFEETFYAFQYKDMERIEKILTKILGLLEEWEFIKTNREDFKSANELDEKLTATILGKRVSELYIDPLTAFEIVTCLRKASSKLIKEISYLHMISSTLEIRPYLNVKVSEFDDYQEKIAEWTDYLLINEPSLYEPEYDEFVNTVKTASMFEEWIDEKDEEYLLEKYGVRPGELRAKLDKADWIMYATDEFARIIGFNTLTGMIRKTRFRLKYGVKEELIPLLKLKGIGRVRARMLFRNGIKDLGDVKNADVVRIAQLIGKNIALDVKKQMGQDFSKEKIEVKENKRKGQISLKDY